MRNVDPVKDLVTRNGMPGYNVPGVGFVSKYDIEGMHSVSKARLHEVSSLTSNEIRNALASSPAFGKEEQLSLMKDLKLVENVLNDYEKLSR
jgi:hypothetical protein